MMLMMLMMRMMRMMRMRMIIMMRIMGEDETKEGKIYDTTFLSLI